MSAEEETARHVPVRRSEAAALTGGGGSMSRRRRDAGSAPEESLDFCSAIFRTTCKTSWR